MHRDDPPDLPSLDLVRTEIDAAAGEQERRGKSFDSKSGFLLGLSGVLIGLTPSNHDLLRVSGAVLAAVAAAAAIVAMLPRTSAGITPRAIRNYYLTLDPQTAKQHLLDTKIWLYEMDEARLSKKVWWMRVSVMLIAGAVALLVVGTVVDFWAKGLS